MPERRQHMVFPFKGLSDNIAFGEQEPGTTRDALNMRGINPVNGRVTGSQRAGMSRFNSNQISGSSKIQELNSVIADNRQITYSIFTQDSEVEEWTTTTPSKTDCLGLAVDRQLNVYALDGDAGIVKYNSEGTEVLRLSLPTADTAHIVRAIHVDQFDCIYAGVSTGGNSKTARMWKYIPRPDDEVELLWQVETGGFIERMEVFKDRLYTAQNFPNKNASFLRVYEFLDSSEPGVALSQQIPYPTNDLSVGAEGAAFTAHEENQHPIFAGSFVQFRPGHPLERTMIPSVVDWTPNDLSNADARIWAWYSAEDITAADTVENDLRDGAEVLIWRDRSGNGRHLYRNTTDADQSGPKYTVNGISGKPTIRFEGSESLESEPNNGIEFATANQQRTMIPAYEGSMFAMFFVIRPELQPATGTVPRCCVFQGNDSSATGATDHALCIDRTSGATLPGTFADDTISYFAGTDSVDTGDGVGDQSLEWTSIDTGTTSTNVVVGSVMWDGQVDPNDSSSGTTRCMTRYAGHALWDRFEGTPLESEQRTKVGIGPGTGLDQYKGQIAEIIILDRQDRASTTEPKILTHDGTDRADVTNQTDNEFTRIEGYLAYNWTAAETLRNIDATAAHPFGVVQTPSANEKFGPPPDGASPGDFGAILQFYACTCKWDSNGKLKWVYSANQTTESAADTGGCGYAVKVDKLTGNVYMVGPHDTTGLGSAFDYDGTVGLRMVVDNGDTFSIAGGDGAWSATIASPTYQYPRIDVDKFGNVYVPTDDASNTIRIYDNTGAEVRNHQTPDATDGRAVVVGNVPDYGSQSIDLAETVYIATENNSTAAVETVTKVRFVETTGQTGSPRTVKNVAVSSGNIKTFVSGATVPATPTGGSGALDSTSQYIQSAVLFQKIYFTDGTSYKVYDPITDAVTDYESTSAGEIPARARLIESWRGRIVLARGPDNPQNWHMAKKDDPLNWDFFPPVPVETQAIAGNNSPSGLVPDIINSIVPVTEDILLFGGDHSIWAMVGDPAAGGRLEMVSDITGMSFGRPWTKDPNGVLYFFGSRGGLYRMAPRGNPERVSLNRIERRLQDVDLSAYHVRLVYNYRDEGVHIFQIPYGAGGTVVKHWFFEIKTGAFWEDQFGKAAQTETQPTAVFLLDADDVDDRTLLIGGENGYVRQWDATVNKDDTRAIDAQVLMGPLPSMAEGFETQWAGLSVVLTSTLDGGRYEMFAVEQPEDVGQVLRSGVLVAGRNPPKWDRVRGAYCYVRLRNSAMNQRFAVERVYVHGSQAGVVRPRTVV